MKLNLIWFEIEFNKWFLFLIGFLSTIGIIVKLTGGNWWETFLIPGLLLNIILFKRLQRKQALRWEKKQQEKEDARLKRIVEEVVNTK